MSRVIGCPGLRHLSLPTSAHMYGVSTSQYQPRKLWGRLLAKKYAICRVNRCLGPDTLSAPTSALLNSLITDPVGHDDAHLRFHPWKFMHWSSVWMQLNECDLQNVWFPPDLSPEPLLRPTNSKSQHVTVCKISVNPATISAIAGIQGHWTGDTGRRWFPRIK